MPLPRLLSCSWWSYITNNKANIFLKAHTAPGITLSPLQALFQ